MATALLVLAGLSAAAFGALSVVAPLSDDAEQDGGDGLNPLQRADAKQASRAAALYWAPGDRANQVGDMAGQRLGDYWPPAMSGAYGRRVWSNRLHRLGGVLNLNNPYRLPVAPGTVRDVGVLQPGMSTSAAQRRAVDDRVAYAMNQELLAKGKLSPIFPQSLREHAPPQLQYLGPPVFNR